MKHKFIITLIIIGIALNSFNFVANSEPTGIFLIKTSSDWIKAGFNYTGQPLYTNESLTTFYMPIALKKEDVHNLKPKDVEHVIYNGNNNFYDRLINISFEILESETYYVVLYKMSVYASNKTFNIDFIPKIKGEELSNYAWFNSSWGFYKACYISNNIDNYQMMINISNSSGGNVNCSGNANTNFSDIRFVNTDNITLCPIWMENYTYNTQATFWVNNSENATTLLMYYGNPNAPPISNGNTTFIFFDDFLGSSLNTTHWDNINSATISVSNSIITISSSSSAWRGIVSDNTFGDENILLRANISLSYGASYYNFGGFSTDATPNTNAIVFYVGQPAGDYALTRTGGSQEATIISDVSGFVRNSIRWYSNNDVRFYRNYTNEASHTTNIYSNPINVAFGKYNTNGNLKVDWVFISKLSYNPPYFSSFGNETTPYIPISDTFPQMMVNNKNMSMCQCCTIFNITIFDNTSSYMNLTINSNYTDIWKSLMSYSNLTNGTYEFACYNFTRFNFTYWFNISLDDGNNTNSTCAYYFNMLNFSNCNGSDFSQSQADNLYLSALFDIEPDLLFLIICLVIWVILILKYFDKETQKEHLVLIAFLQLGFMFPLTLQFSTFAMDYALGYITILIMVIASIYIVVDALINR